MPEHVYDRIVESPACCCENCRERKRDAPKGSVLKQKHVSKTRFGYCGSRVVQCKEKRFKEWHKNLERKVQENVVETSEND